ncbi:MAG: DUF4079 domain-containing protein [Cyanobium sp. M30B3]|jgi:hypothetical protein|nr:MAG: DUF4079 domain-containing protein [Cyanobium sp. M30B3]
MTTVDWLWLLHPALAVALVYPLLGTTVQLALQTRRRRLNQSKGPVTVAAEHTTLGRWLTAAVVTIQLIAYAVVILTAQPSQLNPARSGLLLLVLAGSVLALVSLWRVRQAAYRASFALLCWIGVIGLGMQPEVWRLSDNPLDPAFWQSHFWGGMGLTGLLLFSLAAQPEIQRQLRWRRLHLSANALAALIFITQGITGPRDLLEIPLSWQKPTIWGCNFEQRVCPPFAPPPAAAPQPPS